MPLQLSAGLDAINTICQLSNQRPAPQAFSKQHESIQEEKEGKKRNNAKMKAVTIS